MALSTPRIGLLGGSFDPVHRAHIAIARAAYEELRLDAVQLIPAAAPWQRAPLQAHATHRLAMLERACAPEPWLQINPVEISRGGPTYTIDTLRALPANVSWYWILGGDQLANFCSWHAWEDIVARVHLVVARRSPDDAAPAAALLARLQETGRPLITLELPPCDISASGIRARLAQGLPVDDALEPAVVAYIEAHGLYRTP